MNIEKHNTKTLTIGIISLVLIGVMLSTLSYLEASSEASSDNFREERAKDIAKKKQEMTEEQLKATIEKLHNRRKEVEADLCMFLLTTSIGALSRIYYADNRHLSINAITIPSSLIGLFSSYQLGSRLLSDGFSILKPSLVTLIISIGTIFMIYKEFQSKNNTIMDVITYAIEKVTGYEFLLLVLLPNFLCLSGSLSEIVFDIAEYQKK